MWFNLSGRLKNMSYHSYAEDVRFDIYLSPQVVLKLEVKQMLNRCFELPPTS